LLQSKAEREIKDDKDEYMMMAYNNTLIKVKVLKPPRNIGNLMDKSKQMIEKFWPVSRNDEQNLVQFNTLQHRESNAPNLA
jgi:hypothetical protein